MAVAAVSSLEACGTPALSSWRIDARVRSPGRYPTTLNKTASRFLDFDAGQLTLRLALHQVFDEVLTTIANRQIICL